MASIGISADSHIIEPPEVFAGLEERFGDRAPRIVHEEGRGDFVFTPATGEQLGSALGGVGRLGIAGRSLDDPETDRVIRLGYAGLRPGIADPIERLKDQDLDGVAGEVLYPSLFMRFSANPDTEVLVSAIHNYNDWLHGYCSEAPDRLVGLALIPMQDPQAAERELERVIAMGYRGGAIPCAAPGHHRYHDPIYDGVWARAEEAHFPISMHIFTQAHGALTGLEGTDLFAAYASAPTMIQFTLSDLICQGVAHRFPGLKFVCAEFNTGWIANWLDRLDHSLYRSRAAAPGYLDLKPSEYWRRQFHATFEDDRGGVLTREAIGTGTLLWGNDFPHHDAVWPNSRSVLDEVFEGVPDEVRRQMTVETVAGLYGLDISS